MPSAQMSMASYARFMSVLAALGILYLQGGGQAADSLKLLATAVLTAVAWLGFWVMADAAAGALR